MILIEFKLHAGKVPYFVKRHIGISPINGRFYGEAISDPTCYLPPDLVILEEAAFIDIVKTGKINKPFTIDPTNISLTVTEMTEEEKLAFLNEWLHPTK